jgi:hypothetical protein
VLGVSIFPLCTNFGIVPTFWYLFVYFIYCEKKV